MGTMARSIQYIASVVALAMLVTLAPAPSLAAACPGAGTVKGAANALMSAARQNSVGAFASALSRYADVTAISMFALGKYRGDLPRARRGEYVQSAHRYMSRFLAGHAGRFRSSSNLSIERCDGNLVETTVNGRSRMVWRLAGGRVRDLRVEGVWLGLQLRSKFGDIIRRNDGDVGALVDYLGGE
jgi:ABC-type transporter MlaC component